MFLEKLKKTLSVPTQLIKIPRLASQALLLSYSLVSLAGPGIHNKRLLRLLFYYLATFPPPQGLRITEFLMRELIVRRINEVSKFFTVFIIISILAIG